MTTVVFWFWRCNAETSMGVGSSGLLVACGLDELPHFSTLRLALLETRLLYAGQPPHPSAPPVPLHRPPPGHEPDGVGSAATYLAAGALGNRGTWAFGDNLMGDCRGPLPGTVGGRFKLVGRDAFLAFKYKPQALQMVSPCGDLRQRGVRVVPQLLQSGQKGKRNKVVSSTHLQICPTYPWLEPPPCVLLWLDGLPAL